MNIRRPRPGESERIVELVKQACPAQLHPYIPMTQRGATAFVRAHLQRPESSPERAPCVWVDHDEVLAYADFRTTGRGADGSGFLSYLCVDERARGQGIGTALIDQFMRQHSPPSLQLDVFEDNEAAMAFYAELGFEPTHHSRWLSRAMPDDVRSPPPLELRNVHVSDACFRRYGFCDLETTRAGQPLRVGRIGNGKLRVPDLVVLRDDAFLAAASSAFPSLDEAFVVEAAPGWLNDHGAHLLASSVKLTLIKPNQVKPTPLR